MSVWFHYLQRSFKEYVQQLRQEYRTKIDAYKQVVALLEEELKKSKQDWETTAKVRSLWCLTPRLGKWCKFRLRAWIKVRACTAAMCLFVWTYYTSCSNLKVTIVNYWGKMKNLAKGSNRNQRNLKQTRYTTCPMFRTNVSQHTSIVQYDHSKYGIVLFGVNAVQQPWYSTWEQSEAGKRFVHTPSVIIIVYLILVVYINYSLYLRAWIITIA